MQSWRLKDLQSHCCNAAPLHHSPTHPPSLQVAQELLFNNDDEAKNEA
jgi:hypothetical protein